MHILFFFFLKATRCSSLLRPIALYMNSMSVIRPNLRSIACQCELSAHFRKFRGQHHIVVDRNMRIEAVTKAPGNCQIESRRVFLQPAGSEDPLVIPPYASSFGCSPVQPAFIQPLFKSRKVDRQEISGLCGLCPKMPLENPCFPDSWEPFQKSYCTKSPNADMVRLIRFSRVLKKSDAVENCQQIQGLDCKKQELRAHIKLLQFTDTQGWQPPRMSGCSNHPGTLVLLIHDLGPCFAPCLARRSTQDANHSPESDSFQPELPGIFTKEISMSWINHQIQADSPDGDTSWAVPIKVGLEIAMTTSTREQV